MSYSCLGTAEPLSSEPTLRGSFPHASAIHRVLHGNVSPPAPGRSPCHCGGWRRRSRGCAAVWGAGGTACPWTSLSGVGQVHTSSRPAQQCITTRALVLEMCPYDFLWGFIFFYLLTFTFSSRRIIAVYNEFFLSCPSKGPLLRPAGLFSRLRGGQHDRSCREFFRSGNAVVKSMAVFCKRL